VATELTVAVDAHGADLGAAEVAAGCALASARTGARVLVFGPGEELRAELAAAREGAELVEVRDAPISVAKEGDPARAVRSAPEASIVRAARAVADGEADALVCGGSTGAALAAGLFHIKRARGIVRPALALGIPIPGAPVLLLDVGANVEVRAEHLVQFAHMGAAFATSVLGVAQPRVALLSNGEESTRGTPLVREAHERLAAGTGLLFVGNVEGTGLVEGAADVVVCDGFTGNVALKLIEGVSGTLMRAIRERAGSSPRATVGGALLRPALRALRDEIDPEGPGGAYLLGLRRLAVVCHGRFTRKGYANAITVAQRGVREHAVERTLEALEAAGALRRAPDGLAASETAASVPVQG
jgi:phosphate acyltransferase